MCAPHIRGRKTLVASVRSQSGVYEWWLRLICNKRMFSFCPPLCHALLSSAVSLFVCLWHTLSFDGPDDAHGALLNTVQLGESDLGVFTENYLGALSDSAGNYCRPLSLLCARARFFFSRHTATLSFSHAHTLSLAWTTFPRRARPHTTGFGAIGSSYTTPWARMASATCSGHTRSIQGYLAHKKQRTRRTLQ